MQPADLDGAVRRDRAAVDVRIVDAARASGKLTSVSSVPSPLLLTSTPAPDSPKFKGLALFFARPNVGDMYSLLALSSRP